GGKFNLKGAYVDIDTGEIGGEASFEVPNILKAKSIKFDGTNFKTGNFAVKAEIDILIKALAGIKATLGYANGDLDVQVDLSAAKTFKYGGVEATLEAGSSVKYAGGKLSGKLVGSAKLSVLASGKFDFTFDESGVNGEVHMTLGKIIGLKEGTKVD